MILANDVLSDTGLTLLSQNTELNIKSIMKLQLYQVKYVNIFQNSLTKDLVIDEPSTTKKQVKNTKHFKHFKSIHCEQKEILKRQMTDISDGKAIDISELYKISSDLIHTLNDKGNLHYFLNNLQEFDNYTYSHSINVALVSHSLGQWIGFSDNDLMELSVAGLLHDIGKTKIDISILNKPGKLTPQEYEEMKKHTIYGFRIVEHQKIPYKIKMAVLMHHEKFDGSGYPVRAKGSQIHDYAKIISIADVYDAMTSNRPYRNKLCPFSVIEHMERTCLGKLDPFFLMAFLRRIAYCYLDNWVVLSTGEEGKIKFINKNNPSRPIVQIDNTLVNLSQEEDIFIKEIF